MLLRNVLEQVARYAANGLCSSRVVRQPLTSEFLASKNEVCLFASSVANRRPCPSAASKKA